MYDYVDGDESMVKLRAVLVYLEYAEEDHLRRRVKSIRALVVAEQRTQRFVHSAIGYNKKCWDVEFFP